MVMSKIILLKTCLKKIPYLGGLWPMILMQGSLSGTVQLVDDIIQINYNRCLFVFGLHLPVFLEVLIFMI